MVVQSRIRLTAKLTGERVIGQRLEQRLTSPVGSYARAKSGGLERPERERGEKDGLFSKTVLPHQLTEKPPFGSWSAKKMVNNESTVPVRSPRPVSTRVP
jgi:hypothetical protein